MSVKDGRIYLIVVPRTRLFPPPRLPPKIIANKSNWCRRRLCYNEPLVPPLTRQVDWCFMRLLYLMSLVNENRLFSCPSKLGLRPTSCVTSLPLQSRPSNNILRGPHAHCCVVDEVHMKPWPVNHRCQQIYPHSVCHPCVEIDLPTEVSFHGVICEHFTVDEVDVEAYVRPPG